MTAQEIRALPTDEKVRMMAAIWEDMRDHYEEAMVSQEVSVTPRFEDISRFILAIGGQLRPI